MFHLGISLSITSAVFVASGICMQKMYAKRKQDGQKPSIPAFKDWTYVIGIIYVAIGLLLKIPIFSLVPQTSIAVLSAQNFLYTSALDYFILSTKMTKLTLFSAIAVAFGLILAVVKDTSSEDIIYSFSDIMVLFFTYQSIALTVSSVAFMVGMMELFRISQFEDSSSMRLFYISAVAGLFAAWFCTVTKAAFEVFSYDYFSSHKSNYPASWIVLIILSIVLGLYKMKFTTAALKEFSSFRFLPLYQSFAVLFNAVCGIVYFDEKRYTSPYYIVGIAFICAGTASLLWQAPADTRRYYVDQSEADDSEKVSLLNSNKVPTAINEEEDSKNEPNFSDYPFLNSIAAWLIDLLKHDKSEVHIGYDQYDNKEPKYFASENALFSSPAKKSNLSPLNSPIKSGGGFNDVLKHSSPKASGSLQKGIINHKSETSINNNASDFAIL